MTAANQEQNQNQNHVEAPAPVHANGVNRENIITRIDRDLYEAAVKGNFQAFVNLHSIHTLLTPNKNTVLHVHLTSRTTQTISQNVCLNFIKPTPDTAVSEEFVKNILHNYNLRSKIGLLPNAKGETPLHVAARYGHYSIAKLLIQHAKAFLPDIEHGIGAEKNYIRAKTCDGNTALHEAVISHHIKAKETPLYLAAERKYTQIGHEILHKLKSPAYDGPNDRTALHAAVINRDLAMTKDLVANMHVRGALKHKDNKGWIPLHHAVKIGDRDLTRFLLRQDEDTAYIQDKEGRTALHVAAYCGHPFIVEIIIEHCPDCSEILDNNGWNALHYAVNGNNIRIVNKIMQNLSLSNLYNEKDVDGNTPLHHLANSRIKGLSLIYHGRVDKLIVNKRDQTALDVAHSREDSVLQLRQQGLIMRLEKTGARRSQRNVEVKDEQNNMLEFTKEAKESHLLVATLIATVSFAAGITLPGGTIIDGDNKGSPILGHRASFRAFMISNTISLVLAASAAFIHLFSPLNKAKWKDGYLSQVAFSFTLVAIATMIVAFATATYAVLGSSSFGIAVITTGLAFFLVFRQALKINFRGSFIVAFIQNIADIIIFPFIIFAPRPWGFFFLPFERHHFQRKVIF
ncbi:ankyrin-1-like [Abrus precatorius]|uniref:Ankyrin-1-like n=1 Tax=Abrus precatorius TaxID=3816 RepID=A0A8B8M7J4_ABRPR|nr:ankyrin-1-like [Abrus precatorius]